MFRFEAQHNDVKIPCLPKFFWTLNLGRYHLTVNLEPWTFFLPSLFSREHRHLRKFSRKYRRHLRKFSRKHRYLRKFSRKHRHLRKFFSKTPIFTEIFSKIPTLTDFSRKCRHLRNFSRKHRRNYGNFLENTIYGNFMSYGGLVGIATKLQAGHSCVRIPAGVKDFFFFTKTPRPCLGLTPMLFNGYRSCFLGVKRARAWIRPLTTSSAEIKNDWSCISSPPACFHEMERDGFTIFFNSSLQVLLETFLCSDKYSS